MGQRPRHALFPVAARWRLALVFVAVVAGAPILAAAARTTWLTPLSIYLTVLAVVLTCLAYREATTRVADAQRHVGEVTHLYQATVEMLAVAVESKDRSTHGHVCRVQRHACAVARALGVTDDMEIKAIEAGSVLHDIGKLVVPDDILNKPGTLSQAEFDTMKRHASMGARMLAAVEFPYPVVPIVRHHHEQWDGGGYPDGLVRSEIPLGARILAVVDCFDALTSDRPYRPRLSDARAIEILKSRSGNFYDPAVVEKFIALIPDLRRGDEMVDDSAELLGSMAAGIAQATGGRTREPDANPVMSALGPMRRFAWALVDEQLAQIRAEGCLFVLDSTGNHVLVAHATSLLRDAVGARQLPVGHGISGWVAANRSTIRNADPALDFGDLAARLGLRWCTSTPVFVHGDLIGALAVYLGRPNAFTDQEARFVGTLAQQIGLMLARASENGGVADRAAAATTNTAPVS